MTLACQEPDEEAVDDLAGQMMGPLFADLTTIEFARRIEERIGGYTPPPNYSVSVGEPAAR